MPGPRPLPGSTTPTVRTANQQQPLPSLPCCTEWPRPCPQHSRAADPAPRLWPRPTHSTPATWPRPTVLVPPRRSGPAPLAAPQSTWPRPSILALPHSQFPGAPGPAVPAPPRSQRPGAAGADEAAHGDVHVGDAALATLEAEPVGRGSVHQFPHPPAPNLSLCVPGRAPFPGPGASTGSRSRPGASSSAAGRRHPPSRNPAAAAARNARAQATPPPPSAPPPAAQAPWPPSSCATRCACARTKDQPHRSPSLGRRRARARRRPSRAQRLFPPF